jgi:phage gp16-like protein
MASEVENVLRTLTMLQKALDRLGRLNYLERKQYPPIFLTVEKTVNKIKLWIRENLHLSSLKALYQSLSEFMETLACLVYELWDSCKPKPGKKALKKSRRIREKESLFESITSMLSNLRKAIHGWPDRDTAIARGLEKAASAALTGDIVKGFLAKIKNLLSQRGEKTYIFPCNSAAEYSLLIADKRRFVDEVVSKLGRYAHPTGHKPSCQGVKQYRLCGFRKNPRKTMMETGKQETFAIRMVRCDNCGQKFSLLPSFLPREKNFAIDVIGNVCRNLFLFQSSIQGALQNTAFMKEGRVKSKQTIFNWIRWLGGHHPATILSRAGVTGSGYLQEDEGFEKEPHLRTYIVVMVEPQNLLVWHADYVDHVDEKTLAGSFQKFLERTCFSILGVTKDKWQPATEALKKVFHKIWIGYCHRHCLKRFREALEEYQKQSKCSRARASELYQKFKRVLKTSTSKVNLETKIKFLDDEEFLDPILRVRLDELKENAVYYTLHKQRKGITQTTSIVDNYLKLVKRKLRQAESFRDKQWAALFFRAQANTRNFVPFNPGAKNAGRSPFALAGGQTYDLPWIQVMNVHNAFLFSQGAL